MALIKVFDVVQNRNTGVPMPGVIVRLQYQDTGTEAPIYADASETPFVPANETVTNADGMFEFYADTASRYRFLFYYNGALYKQIDDVTLASGGSSGSVSTPIPVGVAVADQTDFTLPLSVAVKPTISLNKQKLEDGDVTLLSPTSIRLNLNFPLIGGETVAIEPFTVQAIASAEIGNIAGLEAALASKASVTDLAGKATAAQGVKADDAVLRLPPLESGLPLTAAGNGTTNDSAVVQAAVNAAANIELLPAKSYSLSNVTLSNSQSIYGRNRPISAAVGATNIVKLVNYAPRLSDAYISASTNASGAAIRVGTSRFAAIADISAVNCPNFLDFTPDASGQSVALPTITNLNAEQVTGIGVNVAPSVNEIRASNIYVAGQIDFVSGLGKPRAGTIGWKQHTPIIGGIARGGHQLVNMNMITTEVGYSFVSAELTKMSNCTADGNSSYGLHITDSFWMDIVDFACGTARGIRVDGASEVVFSGLRTLLNGYIPSWGQPGFFNGVTTFYDMEVRGTSRVIAEAWYGDHKIAVDSSAQLIVDSGIVLQARSGPTVAAGATVYLCEGGAEGNINDAQWRSPYSSHVVRLTAWCDTAPGLGESYTYTVMIDGAATGLTYTVSGSASFGGVDIWAANHILFAKAKVMALKLVTSAGAAAARHHAQIQYLPAGG